MDFTQAYQRLEAIQQQLQNNELIDIDTLIALQKEAKECHAICKNAIEKGASHWEAPLLDDRAE